MSTTATSETTYVTAYDAVVAAVRHYLDGAKAGQSEAMKAGFHPGATIHGYLGPDLVSGPIQALFEHVDANGPVSGLEARFTSVEVVGTIAMVRLDMDNWSGHRFTDMLTLLQMDGQWLITSKVFHLH